MLESLVEWMSYPLYYAMDGAAPPARTGASHATIYPYGPFPAGDGKIVMLGLQNEREWAPSARRCCCGRSSRERRGSPPTRGAARRATKLRAIIVESVCGVDGEQVVARLDEAQIANAQVNNMHDVWEHPQLRARNRWREVDTPAGPVPALLPPGSWEEGEPRMDAVPAPGRAYRFDPAALGYSAERIAELRAEKAI